MLIIRVAGFVVHFVFQRLALAIFAVSALALLAATVMAAFGQWSWIELSASYQGTPVEAAGMYAQIALTVLAIGLCFFLPTHFRVMQLENSHRSFQIRMEDVKKAYAAVHAADRQQTFQLSSEFDSIRERLAYMRDHPDLSTLEPALLEVAAQMSHLSKELAEVYTDEKVDRTRGFLTQRQQELELFNTRLDQAKVISTEMRHWVHEVELEESVAAAQLQRLRQEMQEIMPEFGTEQVVPVAPDLQKTVAVDATQIDNTVVDMPKAAE